MSSGKEKSLILLSLLGDRAQVVLSKLSSQTAALLTSSIDNSPNLSTKEKKQFLIQILEDLEAKRMANTPRISSSMKSSGSSSFMGGGFEGEDSAIQRDPSLRTPSFIARKLGEQKPQIRAFFLSRLDDSFRQEILSYMSDEAIADYESRKVQTIPLGDKIFSNLYDEICKKKDDDNEDEISGLGNTGTGRRNDDVETQFSSFFS